MGIVAKQTLKGSIWSYLGVIIGFITTTYLYTNYLTPEIVGLFGLIVAIGTITSILASLGFNGMTLRMFPVFRNSSNGHNGFLMASFLPQVMGFLLFLLFYYLLKDWLIANNMKKSELFAEYIWLLVPVTFFFLVFNALDTYLKVLYDVVSGTFLQEFFQRLIIFIVVVLYVVDILNHNQLIIGFGIAISVKTIIILAIVWSRGELNLKLHPGFISKELLIEMIDVAFFFILGGLGSLIVFNIDKVVINQMLDLRNTGVYTIAFYFGTLVVIPSRPLLKIAGTLIADAWAKNDVQKIFEIYRKSCINQFIIGGFLFLGIWTNIDNIMIILGPDYVESKWVIFYIGIGYLVDMLTGANGQIISLSKNYRVSLWFMLVLVVLVLVLLYFLIPIWGIVGAAIAIALALFLNNFMRFLYLFLKYRMQPFNYYFIVLLLFFVALYFITEMIPKQKLIVDILIRGTFITSFTGIFLLFIPIAEDIKIIRNEIYMHIKNILTYKK